MKQYVECGEDFAYQAEYLAIETDTERLTQIDYNLTSNGVAKKSEQAKLPLGVPDHAPVEPVLPLTTAIVLTADLTNIADET